MATKEMQRLRLTYTAAYAAYMPCVQKVSEASQLEERPTDEAMRIEQTAFNDLVNAREALFDQLMRLPRATRDSK